MRLSKFIFLILLIGAFINTAFAIFGSKTTGTTVQSYNDKPILRPEDGDYSLIGHPKKKFVPYDRQEAEFSKFIQENAANLIERDEKSLCQSSNQDFLFLFRSADNFMRAAVPNFKGPLGTGVCWWLTDFQFNFLFLTYSNPKVPKANFEQKKKIVDQIINGTQISELSGYKSLMDFMQDQEVQNIIKSKISDKYLIDSFLKLRWAKQKSFEKSNNMPLEFEKIQRFLKTNKLPAPLYIDLKGLASHSLIALKTSEMYFKSDQTDFMINVLDSNPVPAFLSYQASSQKFLANMSWLTNKIKLDKNGIPEMTIEEPKVYLDRIERYKSIKELLDQFCRRKGYSSGARLQAPTTFFQK